MFETWYKMVAMLQSGLDLSPIMTHHYAVEQFEKAFATMRSGQSGKVISTGRPSPALARRLAAASVVPLLSTSPLAPFHARRRLRRPDSTRIGATCCAWRAAAARPRRSPRTSCRTRCSRPCRVRSGLLRKARAQDVADRHPQAQDRRRHPAQDSASRRSPRSTRNARSTTSTPCSTTTATGRTRRPTGAIPRATVARASSST